MQVIARIGKLKVLNGSTISAVERKECEVQYLRELAGAQFSPLYFLSSLKPHGAPLLSQTRYTGKEILQLANRNVERVKRSHSVYLQLRGMASQQTILGKLRKVCI